MQILRPFLSLMGRYWLSHNITGRIWLTMGVIALAVDAALGLEDRDGLVDRVENRPSQLSGGQQQRVSIARAIAHDPRILFADEPTANLDSETSRRVLDIFLSLHKRGQTILMVTHEPEYAALAERQIELSDGDIVSDTRN
jgi:ABC-type lipoprotein export system ATPase subunit